jgi:hypothetical protein
MSGMLECFPALDVLGRHPVDYCRRFVVGRNEARLFRHHGVALLF